MPDSKLDLEFLDLALREEFSSRGAPDVRQAVLTRLGESNSAKAPVLKLRRPTRRPAVAQPSTHWAGLAVAAGVVIVAALAVVWGVMNVRPATNLEDSARQRNTPMIFINAGEPAPKPGQKVEPLPESAPKPEPGPAPAPEAAPKPEPGPVPAPKPAPKPEPGPQPQPEPQPKLPREDPLPKRGVVSGRESKGRLVDGKVILDRGWMLLLADAPSMKIQTSILSGVDGAVLVVAGGIPEEREIQEIQNELSTSDRPLTEKEIKMIRIAGNWNKVAGFALCVLAGTAMLDGNAVPAAAQGKPVTAAWSAKQEKDYARIGLSFEYKLEKDGKKAGSYSDRVINLGGAWPKDDFTVTRISWDAKHQTPVVKDVQLAWGWLEKRLAGLTVDEVTVAAKRLKIEKQSHECLEYTCNPTKARGGFRIAVLRDRPGVVAMDVVLGLADKGAVREDSSRELVKFVDPTDFLVHLPWTDEAAAKYLTKGMVLEYTDASRYSDFPGSSFTYTWTIVDVKEKTYVATVPMGSNSKGPIGYHDQEIGYRAWEVSINQLTDVKTTNERIKVGSEMLDCVVFSGNYGPDAGNVHSYAFCKLRPGVLIRYKSVRIVNHGGGVTDTSIDTQTLTSIK